MSSHTINDQTDEVIAAQVQKGDAESFGELVARYEQKMLRYARKFLLGREDAEDMVQEVFLKAYVNIQGFDTERRFSPWIYRIAHNEFINAIKKKGKEPVPFFDPDVLFPHPVSAESPERDINEKELKAMIDACLNRLDPKYREPLVLYYFEEMDYQSIAEVMRLPVSTVGVRIKRAKEALQKIHHQLFPSYSYAREYNIQ